MHDPRVAAVIAISPDGDVFGADYGGVASLKVPTLIMGGTADDGNLQELCAYPIYEHLGSQDKSLAMFQGGDHYLGWDTYSKEIKHTMIAFLLAKLKDDPQAAQALMPENMNLPGVDYETTFTGPK